MYSQLPARNPQSAIRNPKSTYRTVPSPPCATSGVALSLKSQIRKVVS
jgi:hypothetical protein